MALQQLQARVIAIARALLDEIDSTASHRSLCNNLIHALNRISDFTAGLQLDERDEGETKAGTDDASKTDARSGHDPQHALGASEAPPGSAHGQPRAGTAGGVELERGLHLLEEACEQAVQLIEESRPQQAALSTLSDLARTREVLRKFRAVHERLEHAGRMLGMEGGARPGDSAEGLDRLLRRDLEAMKAQLGEQHRLLLVSQEQQRQLNSSLNAVMEQWAQVLQPPNHAAVRELLRRSNDRRDMQEMKHRRLDPPLPTVLNSLVLNETQEALPGSVGVNRGTYNDYRVVVKSLDMDATAPSSQEHMKLHFLAQDRCGEHVLKIVAAAHTGRMKLVLENVECTLHHLMERHRRMLAQPRDTHDERAMQQLLLRMLKLVLHAVDGTAALHARRVYHRSLGPRAVLVTENGRAKLSDFGLAKARRIGQSGFSISAGMRCGDADGPGELETLKYTAPEVNAGMGGDSHANYVSADVFSLGAILNAVLAGAEPFPHATNSVQVCELARERRRPDLFNVPEIAERLPDPTGQSIFSVLAELQRLVQNCFADWEQRLSTATLACGLTQCIRRLEGGEPSRLLAARVPPPAVRAMLPALRQELGASDAELNAMLSHVRELHACIENMPRARTRGLSPGGLAAKLCLLFQQNAP